MKSKKNILVSLSFFIVFISILTLFGRNSGQTIQDRIAALEAWKERIEKWKPFVDEHMEELLWEDVKDILREHGDAISRLDKRSLVPPAYDSGWKAINKGEDLTLIHNLGGDPIFCSYQQTFSPLILLSFLIN